MLLVLDEPNSNLDAEGEAALVKAIEVTRERNATVVVVAHKAVNDCAPHVRRCVRDQRRERVDGSVVAQVAEPDGGG